MVNPKRAEGAASAGVGEEEVTPAQGVWGDVAGSSSHIFFYIILHQVHLKQFATAIIFFGWVLKHKPNFLFK